MKKRPTSESPKEDQREESESVRAADDLMDKLLKVPKSELDEKSTPRIQSR